MVFKKMLRAFGVGGPSVDTVLSNPSAQPGGLLTGEVIVQGGDHNVEIEHIALGLVTRVEFEGGDSEHDATVEFHRLGVAGRFALAAGERQAVPFQFPVPWETPVTDVYGQRLHGMTMGLRTELAVAKAVDKGDLDPVYVHPLPVQQGILEAFNRLGFRFKHADLERGHLHGVHQTLPFFQEIEFFASPQYSGSIREVELTFVADPHGMAIVLEFDKRGGFFTEGRDTYGRYHVQHADADRTDWTAVVDGWIREAAGHHASFAQQHGYGHSGHGGHGHRRGHGAGGMLAAGAAGLAGGMIAGEMLEEAFEPDGGDFGDFDL